MTHKKKLRTNVLSRAEDFSRHYWQVIAAIALLLMVAAIAPKSLAAGAATPAVGPSSASVEGYQWVSGQGPRVLKMSQISDNENRACGRQDYEACVGPATKEGSPSLVVKCFIPRNTTVCPTTISRENNCFVASSTPSSPYVPACDYRLPENNNLPTGCHCGLYGRRDHIRTNSTQCQTEMNARIAAAGRAACPSGKTRLNHPPCETWCTANASFANKPAGCNATAAPAVMHASSAPGCVGVCQEGQVWDTSSCSCVHDFSSPCPVGQAWRTDLNRCEPVASGFGEVPPALDPSPGPDASVHDCGPGFVDTGSSCEPEGSDDAGATFVGCRSGCCGPDCCNFCPSN